MKLWVLLFIAALAGWLGFQSWRGLAKGEISDFSRYSPGVFRKADNPSRFWSTWALATLLGVFLLVVTVGFVVAFGIEA